MAAACFLPSQRAERCDQNEPGRNQFKAAITSVVGPASGNFGLEVGLVSASAALQRHAAASGLALLESDGRSCSRD